MQSPSLFVIGQTTTLNIRCLARIYGLAIYPPSDSKLVNYLAASSDGRARITDLDLVSGTDWTKYRVWICVSRSDKEHQVVTVTV